MSEPELRVQGAPGRCPFCRDELGSPPGLVACAGCGARHHAPCYREHGRCATCGGKDVLVPQVRALRPIPRGVVALEPLPDGSELVVRTLPGAIEVEWPKLPRSQRKATIGCAVLTFPLLFGALLLWWIYRYWNAKVTLRLEPERLVFDRPGTASERLELDTERAVVGGVSLDSGPAVRLHLGEEIPMLAMTPGVGNVLPATDVTWLHGALQCWLQGRLAFDEDPAQQRDRGPDEPEDEQPRRDPKLKA